jgi:hypothetical protein
MPSSRIVIGRLLELDLDEGFRSLEDVDRFGEAAGQLVARKNVADRLVAVADMRRFRVSTPAIAERFSMLMKSNSPAIERSALLYDAVSPTTGLQLSRIVQSAENAERRLFSDQFALTHWLDEVLNEKERARLRAFLSASRRFSH